MITPAFDDQTSTFIVPAGGGFEVIFCPPGRSTLILQTYSAQLQTLAAGGQVSGASVSPPAKRAIEEPGADDELVEYETEYGRFQGWRRRNTVR